MEENVEAFSVERFMAEIQKYECLYNKFSREFKDKYKKINCWTKVGQLFGLSAQDAEKKFKALRSDFTRHQKKLQSLPFGSGRDVAAHVEKYECFQWLIPFIDHRRTTSNLPEQERTKNNSNYQFSSTSSPSASSTSVYVSDESNCEIHDLQESKKTTAGDITLPEEVRQSVEAELQHSQVLEDRYASKSSQSKMEVAVKRPWAEVNKKVSKNEVDNAVLKTANSLYQLSRKANYKEESCKHRAVREEDGDSLFCQSLFARLKNLPGHTKAYVRLQIEQVFYQAESSIIYQPIDMSTVSQSVVSQSVALHSQHNVSEQVQQQQLKYFDLGL